MLANYLKVTWRNFVNNKSHSLINLFGLAVGMAACILILAYVQDELAFDRFHRNSDRIYRVGEIRIAPNQSGQKVAFTRAALGPTIVEEFPEVENAVRLFPGWRLTVKQRGPGLIVRDYFLAESSFFSLFDFDLIAGDPETALSNPGSVVVTETFARQMFGTADPMGQNLAIEAEDFPAFGESGFQVTGVVRELPANSHLQYQFLISMSTLDPIPDWGEALDSWGFNYMITYLLLQNGASGADLGAKMEGFSEKYRGEEAWESSQFFLQPLQDIHFHSADIGNEYNAQEGSLQYVTVFSLIAILIIVIACINYMNMATARSTKRAREVGLRKVVGARHNQLTVRFLGESMFMAIVASFIAIGLVELALPYFSAFAGRNLSFQLSSSLPLLAGVFAITLTTGLIAGLYPAFYLSRFHPAVVLKGGTKVSDAGSHLRRGLVIIQFAISIVLIVTTFVMDKQLRFMRDKQLGFDHSRLMVIDINHDDVQTRYATIKTEFQSLANVNSVTVSSRVPGDWKGFRRIRVIRPGDAETSEQTVFFNGVDEDFLDTYQMELVAGRNFNRAIASDSTAVILNESAVRLLFPDGALDQAMRFVSQEFDAHVIGVVKDFHYHSLHSAISPLVLGYMPLSGRHVAHGIDYFTLRLSGANTEETVQAVTAVHKQFDTINPIEYAFLTDWLRGLYESDAMVGRIFRVSALLAILIACTGLFGLAAFMAEQRTKEVGIRKVLGASIFSIVFQLSIDFGKLVFLGLVIAAPTAWFVATMWLEDFAFRISPGLMPFLLAGGLAFFIALGTVALQTIRAAVANPIEALRYE